MTQTYWGIDLGGTKIEGVVLPSDSAPLTETSPPTAAPPTTPLPITPLCRIRIDTEANKGYAHILQQISKLVSEMRAATGVEPSHIGFGTPGVIDPKSSLLKNSNTTCLNQKPLAQDITQALDVPISIANDANCFALAETHLGAAKGSTCSFGVIMGTGVGGGIVWNGQTRYGHQGIAGEWGHNIVEHGGTACYCGKSGCVETVISGPALERYYAELTGTERTLPEIVTLAESNADKPAEQTLERLIDYFGRSLSVVINILDPDFVVLGGGVSNVDALYDRGIAAVEKYLFNNRLETKIVRNQLGDSAGVFGAALLCRGRTFA